MQIGAKDDKLIYQSLKDLFDFSLAVRNNSKVRFIHLFGDMVVDDEAGKIDYKFGEVFIEYFTGICRDYFQLSINEVIGLNSTHAIRIYQILKSKINMDKKEHIYPLQELKKILNIEDKYPRYNNLKISVLELSMQQINTSEASEFHIDYKEIKTGKAVTSIEFTILPKIQNYYVETNQIAGYRLDQLSKQVKKWLNDKELIVKHIAGKIQEELKYKKPSKAAIEAYLGTIEAMKGMVKK
jgi:plasmid replication initiation protein